MSMKYVHLRWVAVGAGRGRVHDREADLGIQGAGVPDRGLMVDVDIEVWRWEWYVGGVDAV